MIRIFVVFIFFISTSLWGDCVKNILDSIPEEDREKLTSLFCEIMNQDNGAYTLFGDKAVSLSGAFLVTPFENTLEKMRSGGIFWGWWTIWERYHHLFKTKHYIFLRESNVINNCEDNREIKCDLIFFINKKEFIKTVENHLRLFETVLNRKINPKKLLDDIESGRISFQKSIENNQMLLGILLGYGQHNASLFNKRCRDPFEYYANSQGFFVGDAELKPIDNKLTSFGDYRYLPLVIGPIHFVADNDHAETKAIRKKFKELRGKISAIYAQGDFLEITLSKLISAE